MCTCMRHACSGACAIQKHIPATVGGDMNPNSKYLTLAACTSGLAGMAFCNAHKRSEAGAFVGQQQNAHVTRHERYPELQTKGVRSISLLRHVKLDFPLEVRLQDARASMHSRHTWSVRCRMQVSRSLHDYQQPASSWRSTHQLSQRTKGF